MAINIKSLNVTLNITGKQDTENTASDSTGTGNATCGDQEMKEEVIDSAVKEVLRILKEQKER